MIKVAKNNVVSMRYIMRNAVGTALENTMNSQPVCYLHGTNAILLLLQDQLEGLQAGDKKTICLKASSGLTDEDFSFDVIIDQVRVGLEEEIMLGYPVQTIVPPCEADCTCYADATGGDASASL